MPRLYQGGLDRYAAVELAQKDGGNGKRGKMKQLVTTSMAGGLQIDLRTGLPYAKLIRSHAQFASIVADYFSVDPQDVVPTAGASGAIEAIRNHVFRLAMK